MQKHPVDAGECLDFPLNEEKLEEVQEYLQTPGGSKAADSRNRLLFATLLKDMMAIGKKESCLKYGILPLIGLGKWN